MAIVLILLVVVTIAAASSSRWDESAGRDDPRRDELARRLTRWSASGLITDEQARAIERFESQQPTPPEPRRRPHRGGLGAEAVGYVGAALAVGALFLLFSDLWQQLVVGGRLALVGLLTVLAGAAGLALNRTDRTPIQRLASVMLTTTVLGAGWFASIVGRDLVSLPDTDVGLLVGMTATAIATPLYLVRRRALPQLTLFVALAVVVGALLARPALELEPLWVGGTFWALGVAWLLLGMGGWLAPRPVAEVLGGGVALLAAQLASFDDARRWLLLLGLVTAVVLVAMAVARDHVPHLAIGAIGLFLFVPQLVFELFGDAIGAPATLLVVGLLLVLLSVGLSRARQEVRP